MDEKLIFKAMIEIMGKIDPIKKERKNQQQGYSFRGIDDAYNELHSTMAEVGVFCTTEVLSNHSEERTTKAGSALIYRILTVKVTFWAKDGSSVSSTLIGEGMDSGDKASNKAMSVAHKYAILQAFLIPTEDAKDPEEDSPIVAPKVTLGEKPMPQEEKNRIIAEIKVHLSSLDPDETLGLKKAIWDTYKGDLREILATLREKDK